ncbi:MAG: Gfo/Idh/MocA family oxidoreductase [Anaerohalosphaera sp.]|nr:Gfo/Idh/MocA family oxidoreductase [Anaerohalosphaera sp.]
MSAEKIKIAILGLDNKGLELLAAAEKTGLYQIVSVAGKDIELAEEIAKIYDCQPFDDYRQLMIQSQIEALIVAAPIHVCEEHVQTALKNGIHVLKLAPPGLGFEHTDKLKKLAIKNGVTYTVAIPERFSFGFGKLAQYVAEIRQTDRFTLAAANCMVPVDAEDMQNRWLWDPTLAGGGILLYSCYSIIDQIVSYLGLPQQVYSLNTSNAPDKQQRLSLTEDTAIITLNYSDTLIANIVASRNFAPAQRSLAIHSTHHHAWASEDSMIVRSNEGEVIEESTETAPKQSPMIEMLQSYANSLQKPNEPQCPQAQSDCLNTMAVIESAYLSARTAMPEDPSRFLNIIGN